MQLTRSSNNQPSIWQKHWQGYWLHVGRAIGVYAQLDWSKGDLSNIGWKRRIIKKIHYGTARESGTDTSLVREITKRCTRWAEQTPERFLKTVEPVKQKGCRERGNQMERDERQKIRGRRKLNGKEQGRLEERDDRNRNPRGMISLVL